MPLDVSFPLTETMPDLADYMTTQEAAEKLGYHVIYIRQMLRNKKLDGVKWGRTWFVSRISIKDYLEKTSGLSKNDPRRGQEE